MSEDNAQEASASVPRPPRDSEMTRDIKRRNDVFRDNSALFELRDEGAAMPTMVVESVVFNEWTQINSRLEGKFMEQVAPNAATKTVKENRDNMRVLFNHGQDPSFGSKPLGPIRSLDVTGRAVRAAVPLLETSYNRDLVQMLGADPPVLGASFRFEVIREHWVQKPKRSAYNPEGIPERTIQEFRMSEFGPVVFPAYKSTTAGLRSTTDEVFMREMLDDPDYLLDLIEQLKHQHEWSLNRAEPDPSEGSTRTDEKPEPSVAATPRATHSRDTVRLFTTTRKEKPSWLL